MSRAFLYVLAVAGPEDLLKIGLTHDPLKRWSSFHARWFEEFDIDHSQLVETETRKDAQALETRLHRLLRDHACPMPLTLSIAAGGRTEWFRGANAIAAEAVDMLNSQGFTTHSSARAVIEERMTSELDHLFGLISRGHAQHLDGMLSRDALNRLRNVVDAHRVFGVNVERTIPREMLVTLGL